MLHFWLLALISSKDVRANRGDEIFREKNTKKRAWQIKEKKSVYDKNASIYYK